MNNFHFTLKPIDTGFFGWCRYRGGGGGGRFPPTPVTLLSLKLDDSNFVQTYFGEGSVFWSRKKLRSSQ